MSRLLTLLLLLPLLAAAAPLTPHADRIALSPYVEVLEDAGGTLGIDDIRSTAQTPRFASRNDSGDLNLGYSGSVWWLRITLDPGTETPQTRLLEIAFPTLDRIDFYAPGASTPVASGDQAPFVARPFLHRNFVFPLLLEPGQPQTLHLRVASAGTLTLPLTLWTPEALRVHDQTAYSAHALYYGMLLALGLYNLMLWFSLRDRSYLAYVAFVAAMAVGQLAQSGLGYQFVWPEWTGWEALSLNSGYAATGFFGALFTRIFLDTRQHHPHLDRLIVALSAGFAFTALAPLFMPYRMVAIATSLIGISFAAVAVFAGVLCLRRGDAAARFFLLAWALLLVGVALMGLRNMALLPTNFLTVNGIQIGSALEMLLLSFALADRIQILRREKETATERAVLADRLRIDALEQSERELEARVDERTHELAETNARLTESEGRLRDMAHHDALTGLANRHLLFDRIEHAVQRATRNQAGFALLLIDLDGFKAINDALGHEAGDHLLIALADRLRQNVRALDTVARLGGDEFVVLVEDTEDTQSLQILGEKIVSALRRPAMLAEGEVHVGASVGGALWPIHGSDAATLLRAADQAMYSAKRVGRNRVKLAGEA